MTGVVCPVPFRGLGGELGVVDRVEEPTSVPHNGMAVRSESPFSIAAVTCTWQNRPGA
jgi:hypothetical protein